MEEIRSVLARFPQRELDIRRCVIRDASFRAICSDYEEAVRARDHWQKIVTEGDLEGERIVKDYNSLLSELEEEIEAYLNRSQP